MQRDLHHGLLGLPLALQLPTPKPPNTVGPMALTLRRHLRRLLGQDPGIDVRLGALDTLTLGTEYGAHTVCRDGLSANSVVYSFGVGEDASFDLELIGRFGCTIHAFDPTPRSIAWVAGQCRPRPFGADPSNVKLCVEFECTIHPVP